MKNAIESTQNTSDRAASPSVMPGTIDGALAAVERAVVWPWRSRRAWIGIVTTASTTARIVSAARQPTRVSSQASIGMKMVEAKPATSVTVSSARSRPSRNHETTTAKAGS